MASRILLADDSITIQKVVNLTFADEGIEVVAVSNGDVAERRLAEVKPDLVLADIFMPGKNGYELCEAIKQNSQFRNVPVVLLVGAFEPFDQAEARRVRADAHLTKPFESRTLVETVRRLISASWRTTTGPIAPLPPPGDEREEAPDAGPVAPPLTATPPPKLDLSAMGAEADTPPVTSSSIHTGELASVPFDSNSEVFDLGVVDMPANEMVKATLTDTSERFEAMELSSIGEFAPEVMPTPFGSDGQEMILDLDKPEPSPLNAIPFEQEPSALLEVDVSGAGEGAEWVGLDGRETGTFNTPGQSAWQGNTTSSPGNRQSGELRMQTETAFAPSDGSNETACATLLAVDEPLGDVLLDEIVPAALHYSSETLDMQFAEPAFAESSPVAPTHFDLVDIRDDSSSEQIQALREGKGQDVHGSEGLLSQDKQPEAEAAVSLGDPHPASDDVAGNLDWTSPRAVVYSTAQLDSVMMPIDTMDYLAKNREDTDPPKGDNKTQEAIFETATTWPEEELRFTPIDSDALASEEPEAPLDRAETSETGFSFSSVATEPNARVASVNATLPVASNGGATYEAELSPAAIEEIVRRVVAEMSESVVREVAWEVVPDCVERVIDQLTRESLSKRA